MIDVIQLAYHFSHTTLSNADHNRMLAIIKKANRDELPYESFDDVKETIFSSLEELAEEQNKLKEVE